ncbi:MAG: hypothetical protein VB142_07960 [Burkholderia sp.]
MLDGIEPMHNGWRLMTDWVVSPVRCAQDRCTAALACDAVLAFVKTLPLK